MVNITFPLKYLLNIQRDTSAFLIPRPKIVVSGLYLILLSTLGVTVPLNSYLLREEIARIPKRNENCTLLCTEQRVEMSPIHRWYPLIRIRINFRASNYSVQQVSKISYRWLDKTDLSTVFPRYRYNAINRYCLDIDQT